MSTNCVYTRIVASLCFALLCGAGGVVSFDKRAEQLHAAGYQDEQEPRQRDRDQPMDRRADSDELNRIRIRPRWTLGILGDDTDTGVEVRRVYPNTAADREGLERGDVIVSVDGYQVGIVNNRRYDLGDELQRRADRRGRVRLLVLNVRNNRLRNLDVRLDERGRGDDDDDRPRPNDPENNEYATVQGRAMVQLPGGALPFNSTLTVQLVELQRGGRPGQVLAEERVNAPGSFPIRFALRYRKSDIEPGGRYGVVATLTSQGRTLFATAEPERFSPRSGEVTITLRAVR